MAALRIRAQARAEIAEAFDWYLARSPHASADFLAELDVAMQGIAEAPEQSVTVRLDAKLQRELTRLSRQLGRSRSDFIRDALRRQLALVRFEQIRQALLPLAEAKGILTDEDVFAIVS